MCFSHVPDRAGLNSYRTRLARGGVQNTTRDPIFTQHSISLPPAFINIDLPPGTLAQLGCASREMTRNTRIDSYYTHGRDSRQPPASHRTTLPSHATDTRIGCVGCQLTSRTTGPLNVVFCAAEAVGLLLGDPDPAATAAVVRPTNPPRASYPLLLRAL